ncbi:MAG: hypothetical protein ACMG6E_02720 [Candidatus Roizmanbacteria bacterium]
MKIRDIDWLTLIVYLIIIYTIWYIMKTERNDIQCSDSKQKHCGIGMGRAYAAGRPDDNDSQAELLNKIKLTAHYSLNEIIWRRSLVVAASGSFIGGYILLGRIPRASEFLVNFLIIYILTYLTYVLFQQWITFPAMKQLDDLIERVKV